jgi:alpha-glucosidase
MLRTDFALLNRKAYVRGMPSESQRPEWWRSAVIYQVYPRSFADSKGDGIGDLPGIASRLPQLAELSIDAVWLSPFYTSPQHDAGYDVADYCDVDPVFGTLDDFDRLMAEATRLGLRVLVDLVPNHTSSVHPWFVDAVAAGPGSPERARYLFRDGLGENGNEPPNNWQSVFGGSAWTRLTRPDGTPEQWYLHLFDVSQPDLDWTNPWVHEQFRDILRFWLRRGVSGFRVDVAHGLVKKVGLPDYSPPVAENDDDSASMTAPGDVPYWAQPGVHKIYRDWHRVLGEFGSDRILCAEAWVEPLSKLADWVRPDEMQQAFNFRFLEAPWQAPAIRSAISDSIDAFERVGAAATWVLSNHDVIRHASRLGLTPPPPQGLGVGPRTEPKPDAALGLRRARAETLLMFALPGSSYLYQGEELGLPEDTELPDSARQDPTFYRNHGALYGRDGCRVPLPWEADAPAYGFNATGASWLPQPAQWSRFARDAEDSRADSTLRLYRDSLALRRQFGLGNGSLEWLDGYSDEVIALRNGAVTVLANLGAEAVSLPTGSILASSEPLGGSRLLPTDTTVWLAR